MIYFLFTFFIILFLILFCPLKIYIYQKGYLLFKNNKNIRTVLTDEELFEIFIIINGINQECDLMNFILNNKIIDENDGADFS